MKPILAALIAMCSFNAFAKCKDADIVKCPEFTVVKTVCDDGYNELSAAFKEGLFTSPLAPKEQGKWEARNHFEEPVYLYTAVENGEVVYRTSTLRGRELTPSQLCPKMELQPRPSIMMEPPVQIPATTISR